MTVRRKKSKKKKSKNSEVLIDLKDWKDQGLNPRLDGFCKLSKVEALIPPLKITLPKLFKDWRKQNGYFEKNIRQTLKTQLKALLDDSPTNILMVRQAYRVPGIKKPIGRRFSAATASKAVSAIEKHFIFFQKQNFHQIPNAECIVFAHGRINPPLLPEKPKSTDSLPRGGMATKIGESLAEIYGTNGDNETASVLQSDTWKVFKHPDGMIEIIEENIPQKRHMLIRLPTGEKQLKISVPEDRQLRPSLSPAEIEEAARVVLAVSDIAGKPQRIEFNYGCDNQDQMRMFFLESANYEKLDKKVETTDKIEGSIDFVIDSAADAQKLLTILQEKKEIDFICVTPELVAKQEETALLILEEVGKSLKILYPGTQGTTHRDQILRQVGHQTFLYGIESFSVGNKVKVSTEKGKTKVENLSKKRGIMLLPLEQGFLAGLERVGGKALRLSEISNQGFITPDGYVIATEVMKETLRKSGVYRSWRKLIEADSPQEAAKWAKKIRKAKLVVPNELRNQIKELLSITSADSWFVRSSAVSEDDPHANFAGKYKSVEEVKASVKAIIKSYCQVVYSAFAPQVINFANINQVDLEQATQIAVLIQPDIKPRQSGVAFRKSPEDQENILIESVRGMASGVVSGKRASERIICQPDGNTIISKTGPQVLTQSQISAVVRLTVVLSKIFGYPQDVEWGFDESGQLIVLQSRDQR